MYVCGKVVPLERVKTTLIGKHNLYNISVALTAAVTAGVPLEEAISAVEDFKGLEHRLELFATQNGVRWFNDSISTIPEAAINAVEGIGDVRTLIIGGMDRGIPYGELENYIASGKIENVIFAYESGKRVLKETEPLCPKCRLFEVADIYEAADKAKEITKNGSVLFSPAAASYGYFKNFEERGTKFKEYVLKGTK